MNTYMKNVITIFLIIWIAFYLGVCWIDFELANPVRWLCDLPSTESKRVARLVFFILWAFTSIGLAQPADLFDWFNFKKEKLDNEQ